MTHEANKKYHRFDDLDRLQVQTDKRMLDVDFFNPTMLVLFAYFTIKSD